MLSAVYSWRGEDAPPVRTAGLLDSDHSNEASGDVLSINGQPVQRQRVREADGSVIYREQLGAAAYEVAFDTAPRTRPPDVSVTVPPDQFFVMGDNRFNAYDSRYFGPISFSSIIGKKL